MRFFYTCLSLTVLMLTTLGLHAQYEMVSFDYEYGYFNNGQMLPAESSFILTGEVPSQISLVELSIFKAGAKKDRPGLFDGLWKRSPGSMEGTFKIPVHTKLHGNSDYDLILTYFRPVGNSEKQALRQALGQSLTAYLDQAIVLQGSKMKLAKSRSIILEDLSTIVEEGLRYYRSSNMIAFEGFSDLIKHQLENMEAGVLRPDSTQSLQMVAAEKRLSMLEGLMHEVNQVVNAPLVIMQDVRTVDGYSTEKGRRTLALNVGYGGVILDGSSNSFAYDTSPYVGISFPLANPNLAGPFWSKLSISLGVFTSNFTDGDGREVSGPIFGRPYSVGLGYNFFRFIRLNAGVTALETRGSSSAGGGNVAVDVEAISLQPFLGLSAEIDLWLGFREKR